MDKQQIIDLQNKLNASGANLKADGIFGPKTAAAYNQFGGASIMESKNTPTPSSLTSILYCGRREVI